MGKQIEITIDKTKVVVDSDTPDFSELVCAVINNQEYDFKNILVECDDEKFDKDSFKSALVSVIESTVADLKIQNDKLEEALKQVNEAKKSIKE